MLGARSHAPVEDEDSRAELPGLDGLWTDSVRSAIQSAARTRGVPHVAANSAGGPILPRVTPSVPWSGTTAKICFTGTSGRGRQERAIGCQIGRQKVSTVPLSRRRDTLDIRSGWAMPAKPSPETGTRSRGPRNSGVMLVRCAKKSARRRRASQPKIAEWRTRHPGFVCATSIECAHECNFSP